MHDPGTRIIGLEGEDEPSTGWKHRGVTTGWIFEIQLPRQRVGVHTVLLST